ncbi:MULTISPECIES: YbjQ family protein [unclassified Olleya]|jgi:uncharacterized protein YbjQ (UPF0145 family)|uniref:YbjQ family protein n=1 Tax=unclassified Olleya TaxID=2615019 RepID=UPI00119D5534|nr:heavy metal-binding domain-containing protein [Olleya sp. Hel_I_94]TVZ46451.1 uncharacterized protein YbjQ (UPF0145 family) [Olleya sp. Hel_I_94]
MAKPKDIIVTTTASIVGMKVVKHIQPVSAHIVLGTNVFSDFLGGLTDVFGGKSSSYQKRLNSIYEDAITKIKYSCYEVGGNCVLGLKIDIDEISGKGKSMFMITAIGTAVISKHENGNEIKQKTIAEKISVDEINDLRQKNLIIKKAKEDTLNFNNDTWQFITSNQMIEVFPFLLTKLSYFLNSNYPENKINEFTEKLKIYIDNLSDENKHKILYNFILKNDDNTTINEIKTIIKELFLLDFDLTIELIQNENISKNKIGLSIATFDKSHYDYNDIEGFNRITESINNSFPKRGTKSLKKQILSSKEKEVWICECSKTNNATNEYCSSCENDIYGFKSSELQPKQVIEYIVEKITIINELTKETN